MQPPKARFKVWKMHCKVRKLAIQTFKLLENHLKTLQSMHCRVRGFKLSSLHCKRVEIDFKFWNAHTVVVAPDFKIQ